MRERSQISVAFALVVHTGGFHLLAGGFSCRRNSGFLFTLFWAVSWVRFASLTNLFEFQ